MLRLLLFTIVLDALFHQFKTGCLWELFHADNLAINSKPYTDISKFSFKKKGFRINISMTKIVLKDTSLSYVVKKLRVMLYRS